MCLIWHSWSSWEYARTEKQKTPRYYQGQIVDYYVERVVIERRRCLDCFLTQERRRDDKHEL